MQIDTNLFYFNIYNINNVLLLCYAGYDRRCYNVKQHNKIFRPTQQTEEDMYDDIIIKLGRHP